MALQARRGRRSIKRRLLLASTAAPLVAWVAACAGGAGSLDIGDGGDASPDVTDESPKPGPDVATYPPGADACASPPAPAKNDPLCPSSYSFSYYQKACSPIGLVCNYPGVGDYVNGCFATAMMACRNDLGSPPADAGPDAGRWIIAQ